MVYGGGGVHRSGLMEIDPTRSVSRAIRDCS